MISDELKTSINTATDQSNYTDSINGKIGTFFIDVTHDTISILHNNKLAGHDDSVVSRSTKNGASVCDEFITTEGNTKLECDTLDYFNPINCYVYDSFRGRNLKGINNYIDSANTPSLENFLKEYSLDVSDTSALNIKDPRLIWNIYTNKDALIHLYIKMILSNTRMDGITDQFLLSIQKLNKEYNTDHEKFISVINGNFLWQTTLYYCYKIISVKTANETDTSRYKENSILHNSIQLLRQIQFTSINDKIQESDAFNWCIGFDNPAVDISYNDDDVTNDRIKNFNKRIYDHFSANFFNTLNNVLPGPPLPPPQPNRTIDVNLDMISNEYCFIGTQPLVGSLLKELHPASTIHARNENNTPKNKSMINGLNQLFNNYFIKSRINDIPQKKFIKTLCLQIIKFAGDSSHINMCYLLRSAWNLIVKNGQYSINISAGGDYTHIDHGAGLNPTKDNKIDTIILTGERIVPVRCIQETISFYVKNFNPFKICSKNNSEILHYTSDFKTQFSSIINKYISYLEDTYIINGIIHSKYYTLFNKLKQILNKHSKLKVEHKDKWKLVPDTEALYKSRMQRYLSSPTNRQIGINLYIDYIEYFKNLTFLDLRTRIIESSGTFNFDDPNSYFNVLHTNNNLRFDNKYVVILKQFLKIYNTDCDPLMYLFNDIFIDNKIPNTFNGILYPVGTNLLKEFDEKVKTEFKTALQTSNFDKVFPNIFYYMACKINMYSINTQRAGRGPTKYSSHPQLKEYENNQFWYSLFPYNGTFNEKGIEDFKIILDATTLQGTGVRDVYINNLKDTFLLLYEFFIKNKPAVFIATFFDNINGTAIAYNTELDNCKEFMLLINKFIVVNKNIIQSHNNLIKDYDHVVFNAKKAKPIPLPPPQLMDYIRQNYKIYTNGLIDLLTHYEEMVNIFTILLIKTAAVDDPHNLIQNLKTSFDKFVKFLNLLIKKVKPGPGDDINWGIINLNLAGPPPPVQQDSNPGFEPDCPDKKSTPTDDIFNCALVNTNILKQLFDRQLYLKKYNTGMFLFYDNIGTDNTLRKGEKKDLPPDFVRFTQMYFDVNRNIKERFNTALQHYKDELRSLFPNIEKLNELPMLGGAAADEVAEEENYEVEFFISNNLNTLFVNVIDNNYIPKAFIEHLVTIYNNPSFNINTIHIEYNNYKNYITISEFVKIICKIKPTLQLTTPQFNIWKKSINIYLTMKKNDINIQIDCIEPLIQISVNNQITPNLNTKRITMSEIYLYIHKQIELYGCTIINETPLIVSHFDYNYDKLLIHYISIVEKINTTNIVNILKLNDYEKYILEYYIIETFILIFLLQSSIYHSYIGSTSIELIIINIYNELCYYCSYNFIKMLKMIKVINQKLNEKLNERLGENKLINILMRQVFIKNSMRISSRVMLPTDSEFSPIDKYIKNTDRSDELFKTYFEQIYWDIERKERDKVSRATDAAALANGAEVDEFGDVINLFGGSYNTISTNINNQSNYDNNFKKSQIIKFILNGKEMIESSNKGELDILFQTIITHEKTLESLINVGVRNNYSINIEGRLYWNENSINRWLNDLVIPDNLNKIWNVFNSLKNIIFKTRKIKTRKIKPRKIKTSRRVKY
jgi:hypothetical protein